MTFLAADIEILLSGGATNRDPNAALGGAISTFRPNVGHGRMQGLFRDATATELDTPPAVRRIYRCIYIVNTNADDNITLTEVFVQFDTPAANTSIFIGLDPVGINGTATTIGAETTLPSGVTFTQPTSYGTGLAIGTLTPGDYTALWIRRLIGSTGNPSAPDNPFTIRVQGTIP